MSFQFSNIATELQSESLQSNDASTKGASFGQAYRLFGKRMFDVFLVLAAIPFVLPIVAILAVLIALRGGKPFYTQSRIGRGGTQYRIWKLRTMIHNADQALDEYLSQNAEARAEWQSTQKLKNDPRITPFGRLLRKTSLDELPQLWNVLNGSMSLVGPRPMMVEQQADYPGHCYYDLRPGITGLWQISDRNKCSFRQRAKFDDEYARTVSFKTDLHVLMSTVGVVVRATGH